MDCHAFLSPCVDRSCFGVNEIFEEPDWLGGTLLQTITDAHHRPHTAKHRSYKASRPSEGPTLTPSKSHGAEGDLAAAAGAAIHLAAGRPPVNHLDKTPARGPLDTAGPPPWPLCPSRRRQGQRKPTDLGVTLPPARRLTILGRPCPPPAADHGHAPKGDPGGHTGGDPAPLLAGRTRGHPVLRRPATFPGVTLPSGCRKRHTAAASRPFLLV
jgi:hypothetical protein